MEYITQVTLKTPKDWHSYGLQYDKIILIFTSEKTAVDDDRYYDKVIEFEEMMELHLKKLGVDPDDNSSQILIAFADVNELPEIASRYNAHPPDTRIFLGLPIDAVESEQGIIDAEDLLRMCCAWWVFPES